MFTLAAVVAALTVAYFTVHCCTRAPLWPVWPGLALSTVLLIASAFYP